MKKIMHLLFLSCLRATELIEKKLYVRLSIKERLQLKMHKMMCDACTNYEKQSILLDHAMHHAAGKIEIEKLSVDLENFKKDIQARIDSQK